MKPEPRLYAEDVQKAVLGAVLLDDNVLRGPLIELAVTDFVGSRDQTIYRTMLQLSEEGEPFDIVAVIHRMESEAGQVSDMTAPYLGELVDAAAPEPTLLRHVKTLQTLSQLRRLKLLGANLEQGAGELTADPAQLLDKLERAVKALREGCDLDGNLLPYQPHDLLHHPDVLTLANVEACPVDWLWKPYLANGMLGMLSGDPGAGKTFIAMAIAAALTTGQTPYRGEPCLPVDVEYLSCENSPAHVLRPRFDSLGGNPARFHILRGSVTSNGNGKPKTHGSVKLSDLPLLETSLAQTGAKLLIVDPIQSYLGAEVDAHRSNETRPVLDGLARLAEERGACILLVRHFAKSQTGRAIHRGLGSIDLTGAVRTELHAGEVDGQRAMVAAKSNLGQLGESLGYVIETDGSFRWTGKSDLTANDLQGAESTREERTDLEEACDYLVEALAGGPCKVKELEAGTEVHERTLRRAAKKISVKRSRDGENGPWLWALP